MLTFGSLFAGIGGLDLGLERAGMTCKWQVEKEEFRRSVLAKHWPDVPRYEMVQDVGQHNLEPVDLIVGGFPCQPYSVAGKQRGEADDRHLWPEYFRIVTEIRPRWVLAENVPGIIRLHLDQVLSDLEGANYTTQSFGIPACAFDAPHRRQRVWIVAHAKANGPQRNRTAWQQITDSRQQQAESKGRFEAMEQSRRWAIEPDVGRVAHGVPDRMDRLAALGDAVVPQVAEWLGRRIMAAGGG